MTAPFEPAPGERVGMPPVRVPAKPCDSSPLAVTP
jgi:hypothetical protein